MTNLEKAAQHEQNAHDSFERCDTDGFLSQWADGIMARKYRLQAEIDAKGGMWDFPALFDLSGNLVPAKLIQSKFGLCWALLDASENFTGTFVTAFPKREATMTAKGYREGSVPKPAFAAIVGGGKGLAGAASCTVMAVEKKN